MYVLLSYLFTDFLNTVVQDFVNWRANVEIGFAYLRLSLCTIIKIYCLGFRCTSTFLMEVMIQVYHFIRKEKQKGETRPTELWFITYLYWNILEYTIQKLSVTYSIYPLDFPHRQAILRQKYAHHIDLKNLVVLCYIHLFHNLQEILIQEYVTNCTHQ